MNNNFIDAHCDTIVALCENKKELNLNNIHIDLDRMKGFDSPLQFFAIWLKPIYYPIALRQTLKYIDFYYAQLEKNKKSISHVNSFNDYLVNKKKGISSSLLSIEGGETLEGEISSLRILYRLGVRAMTLTWNHRNSIADGAGENDTEGGLTRFGVEVVKEMENLGMIVDVSHLSDAGFYSVEKIAQKPYIASHSNARGVCSAKRNLTDDQIKIIAERKGVIGINLYPHFLNDTPNLAGIDDVLKHIDYIINLAGEDVLGFGCDFDGIDSTPNGIEDVSKISNVIKKIEKRYGGNVAEKIAYKNFERVLGILLK